ncbi:DUF6624 domain-containing protein [Salegentibacter mishustinae]|uniref:DUF6624 domain-containing protein n=1 Tax=Salegentibacter mishustinae TaxID=270918 RepID=UPI002492AC00|nr:DUF6624 domain-containing protein [Salegentibacter mishustinae]
MRKTFQILILGLLIFGCKERVTDQKLSKKKVEFNQELAQELQEMVQIDQLAASNAFPPEKYSNLSQEEWEAFKDSIFKNNQKRAEKILDKYGFVGYDLAGKEGSRNFWLIVQHSDHNPDFQNEALEKMEIEVKKENAEPSNFGLLVDRVKLNTGEKQIYGTQVAYDTDTGQAYPRKLADSTNVNQRRKSIGLEPLEIYLNRMSKMHFEMNKAGMIKNGITKPKLYTTEQKPAGNNI